MLKAIQILMVQALNKIYQGTGTRPPCKIRLSKNKPVQKNSRRGNGQSEVTKPNLAKSGHLDMGTFGSLPYTHNLGHDQFQEETTRYKQTTLTTSLEFQNPVVRQSRCDFNHLDCGQPKLRYALRIKYTLDFTDLTQEHVSSISNASCRFTL